MTVILPVLLFLIGVAIGGGLIWFLFHNRIADARQQERSVALADVRVAQELVKEKTARIDELQKHSQQKDEQLQQRAEENFQLKERQAVIQTTLLKEREKLQELTQLWSDAEKKFTEVFKNLATDALKENNKEFDIIAKPVKDSLKEINTKISVFHETVVSVGTNLGAETSKLVKALRKPDVRGQWGEMHLERVLEITGMSDRCDYFAQHVIGDDDCKLRPDVVVKLPGNKHLAVDAKATLQAFLDMADAPDDDARQSKLSDFVIHVRERIKILGSKAYHQKLDGSPEFVVLYLPTEGLFSTALTLDAELLEFADSKRVLLAGPMNLIALLRAVAHGWKQDDVANNAREICTLAEDLYKRLSTFGGHLGELGKHLNKSCDAFDAAVGSLERSVMPQARKFEKLGAAPGDIRIRELAPVDRITRTLHSDDFVFSSPDGELADEDSPFLPR